MVLIFQLHAFWKPSKAVLGRFSWHPFHPCFKEIIPNRIIIIYNFCLSHSDVLIDFRCSEHEALLRNWSRTVILLSSVKNRRCRPIKLLTLSYVGYYNNNNSYNINNFLLLLIKQLFDYSSAIILLFLVEARWTTWKSSAGSMWPAEHLLPTSVLQWGLADVSGTWT